MSDRRQRPVNGQPALELQGVRKVYEQGGEKLEVLKHADLELLSGQITALVGPSGSGKSTLLHIAGLLERPTEGAVLIGGRAATKLSDRERTAIRRSEVGFVYQFHHLLADFTAVENVALPQLLGGVGKAKAKRRGAELLERLGLGHRLHHRPARLSGGEQQRVAIARSLANEPSVLLADEPTGNLDLATSEQVFALLLEVTRERGVAALIATHNPELARRMDRTLHMRTGTLSEVEPAAAREEPALV